MAILHSVLKTSLVLQLELKKKNVDIGFVFSAGILGISTDLEKRK